MFFKTIGYDAPSALIPVHADQAVVAYAGTVTRQVDYKTPLDLRWRQGAAAPVSWCEVALLTGRAGPGNAPLTVVGAVDLSADVTTYAPGVTGAAQLVTGADLLPGDDLWLAVAVGPLLAGTAPLMLQGTTWADPLIAAFGLVEIPGWRPSQNLGASVVFNTYAAALPVGPVALALAV